MSPETSHDEAYQLFVQDSVKHCDCCPLCSEVPCDGVLAGGICDRLCNCAEIEDGDPDIREHDFN